MKGYVVIILLVLFTAFASWQYAVKTHAQQDGIDQIIAGVSDLKKTTSAGAGFCIRLSNAPPETAFWASYALAPRHVIWAADAHCDTVLLIAGGNADSLLQDRNIIWNKADSSYHYYLSTAAR